MHEKIHIFAACAVVFLLLLTADIYWQGLDGPFLLDDFQNIVASLGPYLDEVSSENIYYVITHNASGMLGRPVSVLSLMLTGIVHGMEPWGFKFHNLVIHLFNGLLIFWLLYKLLPRLAPQAAREITLQVAVLVTGIWLLHPLMVSTVLYSVQRMAQLATLFTLAALVSYTFLREGAANDSNARVLLHFIAFALCTLLAVFSKESGALIPLYVVAIELTAYHFEFGNALARKRIWSFLGVFVAAPLAAGTLYMLTHLERFANYSLREFTMAERLMTELHVVVVYIKMILLPRLADMTLFHDYFPITRELDVSTLLLFICFLGTVFLVFYLRKRASVAAFAIAWFLVSQALESTFLSLELMFEHRNYLAAVGPLLGVVYYLFRIPGYPQLKYVNMLFLVLVIFLTFSRVQEWRSRELIYQVALTEHPESFRVQIEMATIQYQAGNLVPALEHLEIANKLKETDYGQLLNQAMFLCTTGNDLNFLFEEAERRARIYPISVYSLNVLDNVASVLSNVGCPEISFEMVLAVVEAAKEQPDNRANEQYLGFLEKTEGQVNLYLGNYQKGMGLLLSSYEHTGIVSILAQMAEILLAVGRLDEAEQIIAYIESINVEARGRETALLVPLQQKLAQARLEHEGTE